MPPAPSASAAAPLAAWRRALWFVVATIILWLAAASLPGPVVPGLESWQSILVDAHLRGRHFGPDLVFTYGPWAFLNLGGYLPGALDVRFVWELAGKLLLAATVVHASAALPTVRRWLFLAAFAFGVALFDNAGAVIVTLLTLVWLLPAGVPWWRRALAVGWLAWLAHFKFIFALQGAAGLVLTAAVHLAERRRRTAAALPFAYAALYLAFWLAAGQRAGDLPEFWRLSAEISHGYSSAMALAATPAALAFGLAVLAAVAALLLAIRRLPASLPQRLGLAGIALAGAFMAWKQGFVRADAHVLGFFYFAFYLGLFLPGLFPPERRARWHHLVPALALVALVLTSRYLLAWSTRTAWLHWRHYPWQFTHLDAWRSRFVAALERTAADTDPSLAATVGRASIDALGHDQSPLLLAGLDYRPRPIPQSYSVYTPALLAANRRHFASASAPEFVLVPLATIDGRYPGGDDAPALAEIARRYTVVREHAAGLLLRRAPIAPPAAAPRELLAETILAFGETFPLPDAAGRVLWLELDVRPTPLGSLRTLLYHASPPMLAATFPDAPAPRRFRLVPPVASAGFFLRPFLDSPAAFAALVEHRDAPAPRALSIELAHPLDAWLWQPPRLRLYALPSP